MTDIQSTKASFQVVSVDEDGNLNVTKGSAQVIYNFPAVAIQATHADFTLVVGQDIDFEVSQASFQVVCIGRKELPYLLSWTATLDGHDYYFLQLQEMTLVWDEHSEQWYNWGSGGSQLWRAQIGIDWNANLGRIIASSRVADTTPVLVGDNASGALYFLDTGLNEDQDIGGVGTIPFQRLVYGQLDLRGHNYVPCNGVELSGSIGNSVVASDMGLYLKYSDDTGVVFSDAYPGFIQIGATDWVVSWRSLGSFKGPGRLFRFEDWGALYRLDSLDMDDGKP